MRNGSTTVRVHAAVRDLVRELAAADGITMDEEIRRLARAERQRRMGRQLATPPTSEEQAVLDSSAETVRTHARW